MLLKDFLVCSPTQLRNVSATNLTHVKILHEMQLHLISKNQGSPDFFILTDAFWPSSNKGNTWYHPEAGMTEGLSQRAHCSSLGNGFLICHNSAGLAFWLFSLLFLSLFASPVFMLKLTFERLSYCPPFFIANNYLQCFGSGGLLFPTQSIRRYHMQLKDYGQNGQVLLNGSGKKW